MDATLNDNGRVKLADDPSLSSVTDLWGAEEREDTQLEHALNCWVYFTGKHKVGAGDDKQCADLAHALRMKYPQLTDFWQAYRLVMKGIQKAHGNNTRERLTWAWVTMNCGYVMDEYLEARNKAPVEDNEWQKFLKDNLQNV